MIFATFLIGAAASHAIGGVPIEFDADRFRGAIAGATIEDGAKPIGHGAIADASRGAVFVVFAGVANLGCTARKEQQCQSDDHTQCSECGARSEDLRRGLVLSHSVGFSERGGQLMTTVNSAAAPQGADPVFTVAPGS